MKRILLVVTTFACLLQLSAQTKQGTISYERKINLWKRITDPERRASIPQFRITKHTLLFCDTVSVFKTIQEEDAINPFEGGGDGGGFGGGRRGGGGFGGGGGGFGGGGYGRMSRMLGSSDGDLYKNFSEGISIQATEQSGKNFLIVDTIRKQPWKITDDTKIILGYTCHKATLKQKGGFGGFGGGGNWGGRRRDREQGGDNPQTPDTTHRTPREVEVVAWFADNIYAPVGPSMFGQLPGAILEVDIDNGSMVFTATEVKNAVSPKDLKEPKKGKKVTREEYMKLMEDLRKNYGNAVPDAGTQQ